MPLTVEEAVHAKLDIVKEFVANHLDSGLSEALRRVIQQSAVYRPEGRSWVTGPDEVLAALKVELTTLGSITHESVVDLQRALLDLQQALKDVDANTHTGTEPTQTCSKCGGKTWFTANGLCEKCDPGRKQWSRLVCASMVTDLPGKREENEERQP